MELNVNARLTFSQSIKATDFHKEWSKISPEVFISNFTQASNAGLACRFHHRCYNCGGSHLFTQCTKQVQWSFKYQLPQQTKFANSSKSPPFFPYNGPTPIKLNRIADWLSGYDRRN